MYLHLTLLFVNNSAWQVLKIRFKHQWGYSRSGARRVWHLVAWTIEWSTGLRRRFIDTGGSSCQWTVNHWAGGRWDHQCGPVPALPGDPAASGPVYPGPRKVRPGPCFLLAWAKALRVSVVGTGGSSVRCWPQSTRTSCFDIPHRRGPETLTYVMGLSQTVIRSDDPYFFDSRINMTHNPVLQRILARSSGKPTRATERDETGTKLFVNNLFQVNYSFCS